MSRHYSNHLFINLAGFQIAWWSAILLGNQGIIVLLVLLGLHLCFHRSPISELAFISSAAFLGFSVDILLTLQGIYLFPEPGFPPLWLLLLWFCFAATLRQSLSFFQSHLYLAALLGGVSGALTYLAAARLDAFTPGIEELHLLILLTVIWSLLFPLLMWLSSVALIKETSDAY